MHDVLALRDLHARAHRSLASLLEHGRQLGAEELHRELEGFGVPTVQRQFHHILAAERYWLSVLHGSINADDDEARFPSIDALKTLRTQVFEMTELYLQSTTNDALNRPRPVKTFRGDEPTLVPAHVILRTQTHLYHHQGQIAAMCRLMDQPVPRGLDFPLD